MSWNPNNTRNDDWNRNRSTYLWPRIPTTEPVARNCPHCHQDITTNPKKRVGAYQRSLAACLCCLILPFCCFWIPLTKNEMNDTIHYCPSCQLGVGIYSYHENNETCIGQGRFWNPDLAPNNQHN